MPSIPDRLVPIVVTALIELVAKEQDLIAGQVEDGHQLSHPVRLIDPGLRNIDRRSPADVNLQIRQSFGRVVK